MEDLWRCRLQQAQERHKLAVETARKVTLENTQRLSESPDSSLALHQVHAQESAALEEYMRVLKIFTELVVNGKMPDGV